MADGDTTTVAEYDYDGRNRRVKKAITNCGVEERDHDGGNVTVHYHYDNQWRILEQRNGLMLMRRC